MAENTIFGTEQAVWKERLRGKSVLEENIRTVALTNGGSHRLLCIGLYIQSSEQVSGRVLRLPARNFILMQTPLFLHLFGPNVLHHH